MGWKKNTKGFLVVKWGMETQSGSQRQWPRDIMPDHILSLWQNSHLTFTSCFFFILLNWFDALPSILYFFIYSIWLVRPDLKALCLFDVFFFQDVRAHLCPPSGEGPAGDAVRPRHADQRRKDRRDGDWPGESLPVQIWSHVRPAAVLLRVSWDILRFLTFIFVIIFQMQPPSLTLLFVISHPSVREWTSGGISWHPGSCCSECVSDGTCQCPSTRTTRSTLEETCTLLQTSVRDTHVKTMLESTVLFGNPPVSDIELL